MVAPLALLSLGCARRPDADSCAPGPHLLLSTTDFEVGALASVYPRDGCVADLLASAGPDAVIRALPDRVLVIDRARGDAIRAYAPGDYARPVAEFVLEAGGNVHDAIRVGDQWWFSLYERAEIVRTDLQGEEIGRIDLRAEADADGLPEADRFVVTEAGVFLALQRLDRERGWTPTEGRIVRLDPERGEIDRSFEIGPNPKLYPDPSDPRAMLVLTGRFSEPDGALIRFDPDSETASTLLTEQAFGRDLSGFAGIGSAGVLLGIDLAIDGPSTVDCVDLSTGETVPAVEGGAWFVEAVPAGDRVGVAVRTGFGGIPGDAVLSVDPASCEVEPLAEGFALDPYALGWVP